MAAAKRAGRGLEGTNVKVRVELVGSSRDRKGDSEWSKGDDESILFEVRLNS